MNAYLKISAATLGFAAVCTTWYAVQKTSVPVRSALAPSVANHPIPAGASGLIVHVDPQTGDLRQAPAPSTPSLTLSQQELNAASTSGAGLVETLAAGGGTVVDLQGRFQSSIVATIGPDGKMTMQHIHDAQPAPSGKSPD